MAKRSWVQKFYVRDILGYSISAVFLWYTFYKSGLHLSDIRLNGAEWWYFLAAILVFVFSLWLYSLRAKLIWINEKKRAADITTYSSLILGNFYNCLLPGNLGEGVRAAHFSRKNNITFSCSLSGTITEKWLDAQVFGILVVLSFIIKPFVNHFVAYSLIYTALAILILSMLHSLMRRNRQVERRLWLFALLFRRVGKFFFKLYYHTNEHLNNMRRQKTIIPYIIYFGLIFILNVVQFFLLQKAAGVSMPVAGIYSSFLVSMSMMIIAFIPSAPSNIGVLHYGIYSAMILAARQYGVNTSPADLQSYALFAIYVHLSFLIPELNIGTFYMIKERKVLFTPLMIKPKI
jgi:uncharacterized protein (TIRG00374 family)